MSNATIVTEKLNAMKTRGEYQERALAEMKEYYLVTQLENLNKTDEEKVLSFAFRSEMLTKALRFKKFDMLKKCIVKLERHAYAPEMNCIHFKSGRTFSTPQKTELDEALIYASFHMSEKDIVFYQSPQYMKHFQN